MRALAAILTLSLTLGITTTVAQAADTPDYLAPAIEQCLRANAAKVEATVPDLARATDFLVSDVCAVPVATDAARKLQKMFDDQKAKQRAMCEKLAASRKSGEAASGEDEELSDSLGCDSEGFDYESYSMIVTGASEQRQKPPAAAALAAQLLIDLRLSHSKAGSSH